MSIKDFWTNVRTGARLVAPNAVSDSPAIDVEEIERILRGAAIWLTPKAVAGFNPADFEFLPLADRQALTESVAAFLKITHQVRRNEPATDEQIENALPHFLRILEVLRPDRYGDPEAFELGKKIDGIVVDELPPSVSELRFETGEDWNGGPALWIWVVFKDEAVEGDAFLKSVEAVRELLVQTVFDLGTERWPFVRFRTISELKPPAKKIKK